MLGSTVLQRIFLTANILEPSLVAAVTIVDKLIDDAALAASWIIRPLIIFALGSPTFVVKQLRRKLRLAEERIFPPRLAVRKVITDDKFIATSVPAVRRPAFSIVLDAQALDGRVVHPLAKLTDLLECHLRILKRATNAALLRQRNNPLRAVARIGVSKPLNPRLARYSPA